MAIVLVMMAMPALADHPVDPAGEAHCPGAQDENAASFVPLPPGYSVLLHNDDTEGLPQADKNDFVPTEGTFVCIKAGSEATGIFEVDGSGRTLQQWLLHFGIEGGQSGEGRDVSHYMTYEFDETVEPTSLDVCVLATGKIDTLEDEDDFDPALHGEVDDPDCDDDEPVTQTLQVCVLATGELATIDEDDLDGALHGAVDDEACVDEGVAPQILEEEEEEEAEEEAVRQAVLPTAIESGTGGLADSGIPALVLALMALGALMLASGTVAARRRS